MVCIKCWHWAYQIKWIEEMLGENNPRRWHGYADPKDPSLYWFIVCKPDCQLNALRHASYRLEQEVEELQCPSIINTVEELRRAWTAYYAYR